MFLVSLTSGCDVSHWLRKGARKRLSPRQVSAALSSFAHSIRADESALIDFSHLGRRWDSGDGGKFSAPATDSQGVTWLLGIFMRTLMIFVAALFMAGPTAAATAGRKAGPEKFTAFAYSIEGKTADGQESYKGTVSADPTILPLRSKIRVSGAGIYSGEYSVADTGKNVKGRVIDIYVLSVREAREFGRKQVEVEILELPKQINVKR